MCSIERLRRKETLFQNGSKSGIPKNTMLSENITDNEKRKEEELAMKQNRIL
jgi:hypothetical protein